LRRSERKGDHPRFEFAADIPPIRRYHRLFSDELQFCNTLQEKYEMAAATVSKTQAFTASLRLEFTAEI
jgi:hypothetical protein